VRLGSRDSPDDVCSDFGWELREEGEGTPSLRDIVSILWSRYQNSEFRISIGSTHELEVAPSVPLI
jgi:hypothetical protein